MVETMNLISINDRYTLPVPDGFHVVEETDKQKLNVMGGGDWMGLSDPGRHLLMTLGWKKVGKLPSKLLKTQGLASAMEKKIRGGLRSMHYMLEGYQSRRIAGLSAEGFRCKYMAQGIPTDAESLVAKDGNVLYYFHFYYREEQEAQALAVWEKILASVV